MIRNLPAQIDALKLRDFNFGQIDASHDEILAQCFCRTRPIDEFLTNRYNVLLGAKGAGKSSVFSLLANRTIGFDGIPPKKVLLLPLDEDLEYEALKALIQTGLESTIDNPQIRAFLLWESYILFRMCGEFTTRDDIAPEVKRPLQEFYDALLGEQKCGTLYKIVSQFNPTFTFKFDATNPAIISPEFSISPKSSPPKPEPPRKRKTIDLQDIKRRMQKIARDCDLHIVILIDHLDDFVAKEDYETQITLLGGLLRCCKGYDPYDRINLKLFLRTDLYEKLDFSQIGGRAKMDQRCVELRWTPGDIRQFIAERLLYNLRKVYSMDQLVAEVDKSSLYIRHQSGMAHHGFFTWVRRHFQDHHADDLYDQRHIHLRDKVYRMLIETFIPSKVPHFDSAGISDQLELFDYLQSHFQLGNGECTPRHLLLYLQHLRRAAFDYYDGNPDQAIVKQFKGAIRLFHPTHMLSAYHSLQVSLCQIFKGSITYKPWQKQLEIFFEKKKRSAEFSTPRLKKMLSISSGEDLRSFIACLEHLRILRCRDKTIPLQERMYELPILLQFIYDPDTYRY